MNTQIPLDTIARNQARQTRSALVEENVLRIMKGMEKGDVFPPILLVQVKGSKEKPYGTFYEVVDGFHRVEAATRLGRDSLEAEIWQGNLLDALAEGVKRNLTHGLQLLKEDMKKAANMMHVPRLRGSGKRLVKGGMLPGSPTWIADVLGITRSTAQRWANPKAAARNVNKRNEVRDANAKVGARTKKEGKEAALKQVEADVLEKFGAAALSRAYEPNVDWSLKHTAGSPGVPVLMLSDIHFGEVVNSEEVYNSNSFDVATCKVRVRHVFETAVSLLKVHMAKPDYPGIVLVLGGDMISGNLHEDHQDTDEVPPLVQCYDIARIVADGIDFLAKEFKQVTVYCVAGNHGRTTRKPRGKFYAQFNLDWLAYKMIENYTEKLDNVSVNAPNARDLNFVVAGHRYRLTHGDQFRGGDGIIGPIGPITRGDYKKRVTASLMPGQPEAYDTMICGHFHTLIMLPRLIVNGSVKGYDEYAMSINCPWEPPQQAMWTVHPKHGQTWYVPIIANPDYIAHPNITEVL